MKTPLVLISLAMGLTGAMAAPPSRADDAELRLFANCTGRMSALREFQWNGDTKASEATAVTLARLADLLEALTTPESRNTALAWRIEAKAAQRGLLDAARYRKDPHLAARARGLIDHCVALLP